VEDGKPDPARVTSPTLAQRAVARRPGPPWQRIVHLVPPARDRVCLAGRRPVRDPTSETAGTSLRVPPPAAELRRDRTADTSGGVRGITPQHGHAHYRQDRTDRHAGGRV